MTSRRDSAVLSVLAYCGFISLGLPDAVLGVAWPSMRQTFALPQSGLGVVLLGMAAGFFISSTMAGRLLHRWGIGTLLAVSTGLVMLALFGYALAPSWTTLVACAPIAGLGSGAIDAGINTYAASHFSPRRMNWLHASYGLGTAIGPLLMTAVLAQPLSWRWGYVAVGAAMLVLTVLFAVTHGRWRGDGSASAARPPLRSSAALRHKLVWLQVAIFFVYAGIEVTAGQWCFALLSEARGLSTATAGLWASAFWGSLFAGRVLIGLAANRLGPDRLVDAGIVGVLAGALLYVAAPVDAALFGLVLLGFSLAPIYPMLMLRTPGRLGPDLAAHAIGFQVSAAMLGGVVIPSFAGALADRVGLEATALVIVVAALGLLALVAVLRRTD
jgi:fucose permease